MRRCQHCGRVRFYSLNFIFSESICNECYMLLRKRPTIKVKTKDHQFSHLMVNIFADSATFFLEKCSYDCRCPHAMQNLELGLSLVPHSIQNLTSSPLSFDPVDFNWDFVPESVPEIP